MSFFLTTVLGGYAFHKDTATDYYKQGTFTKQEQDAFLQAAFTRGDMAATYILLFKDAIDDVDREKLFDSILTTRDHALAFMKKKIYTESERIKFQQEIAKMPKVFFKYLKKFPDMLREEEKEVFYQNNKERFVKSTFREDFDGFESVFRDQIARDEEIKFILEQLLRLKKNVGSFIYQFLNYLEKRGVTIPEDTTDILVANMIMEEMAK